jgi:coniferyl-aldehyde dehydrogenase
MNEPSGHATTGAAVNTPEEIVRESFEPLRRAYLRAPYPSYAERCTHLDALCDLLRSNQQVIAEAIAADFGGRSTHETRLAEVFLPITAVKYIRYHLRDWMKSQSRRVPFIFKFGSAKVVYQPLGVVGIIAPWNYPFQLAIEPAAYALAAGNRVLIKPSEFTPHAAELLKKLVSEHFDHEVMSVITGGPDVAEAFSKLPFDHILFTGSAQVGRMIMKAAAENLVPVTLELGGKSPTILHDSFPLEPAVRRIVFGKWANAWQTCIAPDYVLVSEGSRNAFIEELVRATRKAYPTIKDNSDYTSIISMRHYERLCGLIADAEARGARKIVIRADDEQIPDEAHRLPPTLLLDVRDDMKVMQEEIFGPILPIMTYRSLDDAITYVNQHPRPLALYYFDHNRKRACDVLQRTISGGVSLNDIALHFFIDDLPFGGVGASGMGRYHSFDGFETFSHKKPVFAQSRFNAMGLLSAPYGNRLNKILKVLIGSWHEHPSSS